MDDKPSVLERVVVHLLLVGAVAFALYPVLWVVSLALSQGGLSGTGGVVPLPRAPTLENFRLVLGTTDPDGAWLFGWTLPQMPTDWNAIGAGQGNGESTPVFVTAN